MTYWILFLFVTSVRQPTSESLKARHPVIKTFDRCVGGYSF